MRRSGLLWWIGALVLAVVAGFLAFRALSAAVPRLAPAEGGGTQPVVVAAVDIPARRSISAEELTMRDLPVEAVPAGAATAKEQVVGKMATAGVYAGETLLMQQLVTPDIVTRELALSVPEGKIVLAVPTDSQLISNRLIRPGDHIDLLSTFEVEVKQGEQADAKKWSETVALLQDLEVHAIILAGVSADAGEAVSGLTGAGPAAEQGGVFTSQDARAQSLLLAVDTQDALTIRHVLDIGGVLDIALRAPDDESLPDTVPVDQVYLADRYQIDLAR